MKTIKSTQQLKAEKKRLAQHQHQLEQKILHNWTELKESISPSSMAAEAFSDAIKNNSQKNNSGNGVLKNIFAFGVTILAKKLADKTGEKLGKMFTKN